MRNGESAYTVKDLKSHYIEAKPRRAMASVIGAENLVKAPKNDSKVIRRKSWRNKLGKHSQKNMGENDQKGFSYALH
jgi:hypothetical protein